MPSFTFGMVIFFAVCVCACWRRAAASSSYLSIFLSLRACVGGCACVCLRPAALKRPQRLCRGLLKKMKRIGENYSHKKRESAHKRVFFFHTFVRSLSTRSAVARRHARAWGKEKRDTSAPLPVFSSRARVAKQKSRIGRVSYERARVFSLSLSLSVERCPCPRTRRPDESRGRSPSSPRLDCSLDRRF